MTNNCKVPNDRHSLIFLSICFVVMFGRPTLVLSDDAARVINLEKSLGQQGSISVRIRTDRAYGNGPASGAMSVDLFELPEVAKCRFVQASSACELQWVWHPGISAEILRVEIQGLPGPEEYFLQYTWDATTGRFTGYVNGSPLRLPDTQLPKWKMPILTEVRLPSSPIAVTLMSAEPRYLDQIEARNQVPQSLVDCNSQLFGGDGKNHIHDPIQVKRGQRLYDNALCQTSDLHDWVMEGPGQTDVEDNWLIMKSKKTVDGGGHFVYWCPNDFPSRFVAEWDVQLLSTDGLCITFFAAKGGKGEDLFDAAMSKRTGVFKQYTQGAINCYHISYFANTPNAPGRITSNMRKNHGFHLVANGPPGIVPGSTDVHSICLIKNDDHVQLQVDDRVIIDFVDDGRRYGPVLGGGKIGFRQMEWTVARYRNFRVHELVP